MMTIEITHWTAERLALTGLADDPAALFAAVRAICPARLEFRNGTAFTFSFPSKYRRQVARLMEGL